MPVSDLRPTLGGRGPVGRHRRDAEGAVSAGVAEITSEPRSSATPPVVRQGGAERHRRRAGVRQGVAAASSRGRAPTACETPWANPAQWNALADSAVARGEIPWISQESPPRPPMLPNFGQVQAWLMTPTEVMSERPPAPPSTSSDQMRDEVPSEADGRAAHASNLPSPTNGTTAPEPTRRRGIGTTSPRIHSRRADERGPRRSCLSCSTWRCTTPRWGAGVKYLYFNPRRCSWIPASDGDRAPRNSGIPVGPLHVSRLPRDGLSYLSAGRSRFRCHEGRGEYLRLYAAFIKRRHRARKEHGARIGGYARGIAHRRGELISAPAGNHRLTSPASQPHRPTRRPGSLKAVHKRTLQAFMIIVIAHWAEHLVQARTVCAAPARVSWARRFPGSCTPSAALWLCPDHVGRHWTLLPGFVGRCAPLVGVRGARDPVLHHISTRCSRVSARGRTLFGARLHEHHPAVGSPRLELAPVLQSVCSFR